MHEIKCKNPNCIGGRIETTMEGDDGYSNWTVMSDGFIEFKCHGCGKFGSTDEFKDPNELDNFEVTCKNCHSHEWGYEIKDVDGENPPTRIICKGCGATSYQKE